MRVSCGCLARTASEGLAQKIQALGVEPIVTQQIIRGVYDGKDKRIGEGLVKLFVEEQDHDIYVHYDPDECPADQPKVQPKPHPRSSNRKKAKRH